MWERFHIHHISEVDFWEKANPNVCPIKQQMCGWTFFLPKEKFMIDIPLEVALHLCHDPHQHQ